MKKLIRVLGVVAGVAAVVWLTRDRLLPTPKVSSQQPPPFRHHEPGKPTQPEPAAVPAQASESTAQESSPDDLTVIKGIGPVRSSQMAEEGITTFADLAAADPKALAEQFDVAETAAADWVAEAASRGD